jgi:saccharopine dehydrogenase-like NADP-dependent oxidoreductase
MRIIVLGGGGAMGMVTARDLAASPDVAEVIIGEADLNRAQTVNQWIDSAKVSTRHVDVTRQSSLLQAVADVDAIANATPYHLNLHVTKAAIAARKPLVDLGGVYYATLQQLKLDEDARKAGVTVALGCGLAPGIADILAKRGAENLDTVEEVHIHYGETNFEPVKYKWSFRTVLEEYTSGPVVFVDGKLKQLHPFAGKHHYTFPPPIGEQCCCYALYSGIATLPTTVGKGVRQVDCAMSLRDQDEQRIAVLEEMGLTQEEPVTVGGVEVSPREVLLKCAPPPDVAVKDAAGVAVDVSGHKDGHTCTYTYTLVHDYHEEFGVSALAYLTGVPMAIVAPMLPRDDTVEKGVLPAETVVKPKPFFAELSKRGVKVRETVQRSREI